VVRRQRSTSFSFNNNKIKTKQSFVLLVLLCPFSRLSLFKLPIEQQSVTVVILFVIVVESENSTKKVVCKSVYPSVSPLPPLISANCFTLIRPPTLRQTQNLFRFLVRNCQVIKETISSNPLGYCRVDKCVAHTIIIFQDRRCVSVCVVS